MIRDQDEDASAPLELPRDPPSPGAAPRPAAMHSDGVPWGISGVFHQVEDLITSPGTPGIVRLVVSGVHYAAPPLPRGDLWRSVPSEPGRFELNWGGDPHKARTLAALRRSLELQLGSGELARSGSALLAELDRTVDALAAMVERLHRERWSVGLLQPANVLFREGPTGLEAVPIDLGFTWRGAYGSPPWDDSPGRPDWLDSGTQPTWLWDHDPVRQQFADPGSTVYPRSEPVNDVRTLGRLLAWVVSGQTSRELPMVSNPSPLWATLVDAAAGRIATVDVLRARLRETPLSGYFRGPPKTAKGSRALALVALLALAGAGGVAAWLALKDKPPASTVENKVDPTPPPPKPPDPAPMPMPMIDSKALLDAIDQGLKDLDFQSVFDALKKLAAAPGNDAEVAKRRDQAREAWISEANSVLRTAEDPTKRLDARMRLGELIDQLKTFMTEAPAMDPARQEKEQQCLDLATELARQLASQP